jgi:hypothetical protein
LEGRGEGARRQAVHGDRRRGSAGARDQFPLEPPDVVPGPQLPAEPLLDSREPEAAGLVEGDARRIRQGDPRKRLPVALAGQHVEQRTVERAPEAGAAAAVLHIDARLHRPPVGWPRLVRVAIGVPGHATAVGQNEPRIGGQHCGDPGGHLLDRRGLELEADRGRADDGGVDRADGDGVGRRCEPDLHQQNDRGKTIGGGRLVCYRAVSWP